MRKLLFVFPTRVNLTSIKLFFYNDAERGLPRLRFYAVPDDFDVWDDAIAANGYKEISAIPNDVGSVGRTRTVQFFITFHTARLLMEKYASSFKMALSEVQFKATRCVVNCTYITYFAWSLHIIILLLLIEQLYPLLRILILTYKKCQA